MFDVGRDEDTICALSTAAGRGGISVIRVSGSRGAETVKRICPFLPSALKSHTVYFGTLRESSGGSPIDEVLVSYFEEGRSYTGEETLEISCHGSAVVAQVILDELVRFGARVADRGEFTYRAFMSGRIDLVQAEAVLSLVESQSKPAMRMALRQLKGELSQRFKTIESELVWLLARLEVSLDFSTEDITVAPKDELLKHIEVVLGEVSRLLGTFEQGRLLKEGLQVGLVGRPNVGKSSLLNALMKEERAIVTDIAGTTRDTIEGRIRVQGFPITVVDTAGLRVTDDPIEKMGVERTKRAAEEADVVLFVVDGAEGFTEADESVLKSVPLERLEIIFSKADLISAEQGARLCQAAKRLGVPSLLVSSKTHEGLTEVEELLASKFRQELNEDSDVVIQSRHFQLLIKIKERVERAAQLISDGVSEEFTALELRTALQHTHEILGVELNEQVIDRIFGDFCIGK